MANKNPIAARLAQRRRRKPGNLRDMLKALWQAIRDVERALETAETHEQLISAAHAMSACANSYHKLLQADAFEERITALEAKAGLS